MNMGNTFGNPFNFFDRNANSKIVTKNNESSEEDYSSSSSDEEIYSAEGLVDSNFNLKQCHHEAIIKFSSDKKLSLDIVGKIEKDLDFHDTISMIFLLYETHLALDIILTILSAGPFNFSRDLLSKWAHTKPPNYSLSLIEALCVIQNYKVLNNLGYYKAEIDTHFQPRKSFTLHLNKIKKVLYLLCESLTKDQTKKLIDLVRHDKIFTNDVTRNCDSADLEFYVLFWISRGYISIEKEVCLKNLTKHLKQMDFLDKVDEIDNIVNIVNSERSTMPHFDENDAYPIINPENVGLCIIVNMAKFTKNVEKKEEFKHLLPNIPLDDRHGSLKDVENLKNTFTHLKFTVVEVHDVFHYHFEWTIQSIVRENFKTRVHSVLVLCILSHGDKGVVYASNSIPVTIHSIQAVVSGPTPIEDLLANIPKVIIIQACQGHTPLFVEPKPNSKLCSFPKRNGLNLDGSMVDLDGSVLQFDSPQFFPKYADVLTCLAIIEGFVAVRSVTEGTKYVQEFCKCLKDYYKRDHLLDIVTRVHNNLNSKLMHVTADLRDPRRWNCREHSGCVVIYMTPEVKYTLRKKLYLTPLAFKSPLQQLL